MSHRLHADNLRKAAAACGDTTDYKIMKRTGISKSAISRLVNQQVEPTVSTLKRLAACYGLDITDLLQEVAELAEAS